jgi:broad specificity phosphatase PhoE
MPKIYLIRHGRAAAGWGESDDPGLDSIGHEQAVQVSRTMQALNPMPIVSSPMKRARETAEPLAQAWERASEIDPRFSEIPTPEHIPHNRKAWIKDILSKRWDALDTDLQAWRETLLTALCSLQQDTVVFTHFIAINAIAGKAMDDHKVLVFMPDNTSITSVKVEGSVITLLEKGTEMPTIVG